MPMGITRVADQYGFLPEAERRREYLAAMEGEARQIAAAHHGARIPQGTNDPRGRFASAQRLAGDVPHEDGGEFVPYNPSMGEWEGMTPLDREELEVRYNNPKKWRKRRAPGPMGLGMGDFTAHQHTAGCDCDDDSDESDPDDGFGGKKAPPFGKKDAGRYTNDEGEPLQDAASARFEDYLDDQSAHEYDEEDHYSRYAAHQADPTYPVFRA